MRINRINALIKRAENKHVKYLDNEVKDMMSSYKFGGLFANDRIELHSAPETVTKVMENLKIVFERFKK
jgi:hypothetical protein